MEVQIASTLKLLSSTPSDKSVQIHGLKLLLESCDETISNETIKDLPIVETTYSSIKTNNTVKQVLKLGCSVLISYSQFTHCSDDVYRLGVIPYLCTQITRLASESVLSMELAVIAAYGISKKDRPDDVDNLVLSALFKIEKNWLTNATVLQQIITNYAVIAQKDSLHTSILSSQIIDHIEEYLRMYKDNQYIISGLLSICDSLSLSQDGRTFLCSKHIFQELYPLLLEFPQNHDVLVCCLHLLLKLNCDQITRDEVINKGGIPLLVRLTNFSQSNEEVCCEAVRVIRSICSAENESVRSVVQENLLSSLIMCMSSYPMNTMIIIHGVRALAWLACSNDMNVIKMMIDEGVFMIMCDVITDYTDTDAMKFSGDLLVKMLITLKSNEDYCIESVHKSGLLLAIKEALIKNNDNESIIYPMTRILAVLCSFKKGICLVVATNLCSVLLDNMHHVQFEDSLITITAVMWKCCLIKEGITEIYKQSGVDIVIQILQTNPNNSIIQRNCCGILLLLLQDYIEVSDIIMSRLAVLVIMDSIQDHIDSIDLLVQAISLLHILYCKNARCRRYMTDHDMMMIIITVFTHHQQQQQIVYCCLAFIHDMVQTKEGKEHCRNNTEFIALLQTGQYEIMTKNIIDEILIKISN